MPGTANLALEPIGRQAGASGESTHTSLLNRHGDKLPSEYFCLHTY